MKLKLSAQVCMNTSVYEGVRFLGFVIRTKTLGVDPKRVKRFKNKVRRITRRNSGRKLENIIKELNPVLRG